LLKHTKVLISVMKDLALKAGERILEIYRRDFAIEYKEDHSPVTEADKEANALIVSGLKSSYPDIPVLAEESEDDRTRLTQDYCFVVDPLDGTKEFVGRNGEFTVNIALTYSGKPVAGLIYVPVLDELYYAALGEGAYFEVKDKKERIRVSQRVGDIRLAVSRSHCTEELDKLIERNHIHRIIVAGSAYKGCLVARGEAEAYYRFGRTMEWDTAAMEIIVTEAGGIFKGMDGRDFLYNKENAENPTGFYTVNRPENLLK
jgi:3'(2'), 5'-bisphosphate nucleotidase